MITAWSVLVSTPAPVAGRPLNMIYVAALLTAEAAVNAVLVTRHNIQGETAEAIAVLNESTIEHLNLRDEEVRIL
jgi:hypothetical protein